ncbi:hypothetical protein EST38_g606 [Candolleomyces aberdarensis]|uniref:STB6-like N-terminal domain-containing protein n=1 Tax=Candolleomyces aberdarensis TaxID=2316362 RepID=A0A4V1Q5D9_9AGAR|nr:hypothetical protein EST38_g606 [Candolleomyces aberdarensis]
MVPSILLPVTRNLWFDAVPNGDLQVAEYQMYAVEKWIVDRSRPIQVLLVYTGDPSHSITLSSYDPTSQDEYDKALHQLRRDGARPKQTPHGVLMATSLAHFRSDYTIVKIPDGDYRAVKDHLYANINLLRMGCSGRSALALEEPTEATKDRFLSAYHLHIPTTTVKSSEHLPSVKKGKDRVLFTATVLELVKLIQAALAIFACYGSLSPPSPAIVLDGLLCDETVEGIHKWIAEIGEPCLGLEPTERVADPSIVSALLSMVLAIRNRLAALCPSHTYASSSSAQLTSVPKDPFVYPYAFSLSLLSYLQYASTQANAAPIPTTFHTQMGPYVFSTFSPQSPPAQPASSLPVGAVLTKEIVEHIGTIYDKTKSSDNKRVRRKIKDKLDDLTSAVSGGHAGPDSEGDEPHHRSGKDKRSTLSDSEAPHLHIISATPTSSLGTTSGNRVLGGIGTLLMPGSTSLSTSLTTSPGASGGAGSITEPIINLSTFLSIALSKETGVSSGRRGANLKRIRGSVGGGTTATSAAAGEHSIRMGVGKSLGVGKGLGKSKRQRDTVDLGSFYHGGFSGAVAMAGAPSVSASGSNADVKAGGVAVAPTLSAEKEREKDKEVVVAGSVKALWGGRVMDLVKMREWCEEVAQSHHLGSSVLILPSSAAGSQRAVSGSTVNSQQSTPLKDKGKKAKDKHKPSPSGLLNIHSDVDLKSDAGRSTEGEESESVYPSASNTPLLVSPEMLVTGSNPIASASFGSLLSGRVKGKLGHWAGGLGRRKGQSVDFSVSAGASPPSLHLNTHGSIGGGSSVPSSIRTSPVVTRRAPIGGPEGVGSSLSKASGSKRGTLASSNGASTQPMTRENTSSGPQSPTLPPMVYSNDGVGGVQSEEDEIFDVDVLSSGQISPLSDHRSNNPFISSRSKSAQRHLSLTLPPSQQDRNYLSVSTINEKLSRLSELQRLGDNANAKRSTPSLNPGRRLFLYSQANSASNINTSDLTGNEDVGGGAKPDSDALRPPLRRPSWSDPMSARHILGSASASNRDSLDFANLGGGGKSDNENDNENEDVVDDWDKERMGRLGGPFAGGGLGAGESEAEMMSDSYVSRPLRPSLRTRRTEYPGSRFNTKDGDGNNSSKERREREKKRFHSLLSIVDQDGNHFLEEPLGSWDPAGGQLYSYDPDELEGLYPYDEDMEFTGAGPGFDINDVEWVRRRRRRRGTRFWYDPMRRRSFHDLDDFYEMPPSKADWMRVDVEMCGQVLVMLRREEHLRNVVESLGILNTSLSATNTLLRQEYESHLTTLSQLSARTKILADIDLQSTRTDNLSQQANVLRYEAEQFHVPSLYHAASLSRQKVLDMRHKVFGVHKVFDASETQGDSSSKKKKGKKVTGSGRVLPQGVRGAHGKFNRLQQRLDGREVVVDWLGRTESDVEEEERLARHGLSQAGQDADAHQRAFGHSTDSEDEQHFAETEDGSLPKPGQEMEDGENVVEHSSIRPMWLLKFFMGWGAMWTARTAAAATVNTRLSSPDPPEKDGHMGTSERHRPRRSDDDETMVDEDESRKDR